MKEKKINAFTLTELLLVTAIMVVMTSLSIPFALNVLKENKTESLAREVESTIFITQQNSYTNKDQKIYGIAFQASSYTTFVGNSLASAESSESFNLPSGYTFSNISLSDSASELIFPQGSFKPSKSGSVTITNGNVSHRIYIDSEGLIYEDAI